MATNGTAQLRFNRGMRFEELGSLLEQGYQRGSRLVEVAFEDVDKPELVCRPLVLRRKGNSSGFCLGGKVLDMLGERRLPMGTLTTRYDKGYLNREPFSAYLVYTPVR
ncbi:MAG: hypothetical protein AABX32_05060 [Nanoarchaeota archaeon]